MKLFLSEVAHDYGSYTFAYANYCMREEGDALADIYKAGFLPYSGARGVKDTLYMARSARIALKDFGLTSENRRIAKKFDGVFTKKRIPFETFDITETFLAFCLDYFRSRHGAKVMPGGRLETILASGFISDVIEYKKDERIIAYVLEVRDKKMAHFWFSFYDLSLTQQSLGLWLMLDCMRDAKAEGLSHYYIGTVYGEKAMYKTNFEPLEWWSGEKWSDDFELLKKYTRTDKERSTTAVDEWKKKQKLF